jgi:hypothetical protein
LPRKDIEGVTAAALGESAPDVVERIRQAPQVENGIACFVLEVDEV